MYNILHRSAQPATGCIYCMRFGEIIRLACRRRGRRRLGSNKGVQKRRRRVVKPCIILLLYCIYRVDQRLFCRFIVYYTDKKKTKQHAVTCSVYLWQRRNPTRQKPPTIINFIPSSFCRHSRGAALTSGSPVFTCK